VIRLRCLEVGHRGLNKLKIALGSAVLGDVPGIARSLLYRPEFFGKAMGPLHNQVVRGASEWTMAERELFSAYVSAKNSCRFCFDAHSAVADRAFGHAVVDKVMADDGDAPVGPKVRAMLPFLDKLTVDPQSLNADDVRAVRAAGVSDAAMVDAIMIAVLFAMFNRIVFATGVEPMSPRALNAVSFALFKGGYDL
jgi:uncharacterized peroxidase-related enzyme